jgi:hypothetical protein
MATEDTIQASENAIEPAPSRRQASAAVRPEEEGRRSSAGRVKSRESDAVPDGVRKKFVRVRNTYYFPDGVAAFVDRGNRLTTSSENTEVIRSLVAIAESRGWDSITVTGTDRFRKEAWFAAHTAGLDVIGYQLTEFERQRVARAAARQSAGPMEERNDHTESAPTETRGGLLTGRLVDHGRAAYQNDPKAPISYFIKLETGAGDRLIWGVDLERAFRESLTKPQVGDEVSLRSLRREPVRVKTTTRDEGGEVIGERDLDAYRNRWVIEKRGFFEVRAEAARTVRDASMDPKRAVKQHPELVGTYLQIHAAELAAKRFRDSQDRELFVQKVRSALADAIARGEPLPPVRLRERATERAPRLPESQPAPVRG